MGNKNKRFMRDRNDPRPQAPIPEPSPIADVDDIVLDEHRRSPQFIFVQEKVKKLPPPGKLKSDIFNWKLGQFREAGPSMVLRFGVQFAVAAVMCLMGVVVEFTNWIPGKYSLLIPPPENTSILFETFRAIFLLGVPFLLYVSSQIAICLIPWLTYRAYKQKNQEPHEILRSKIELLLSIRYYIGCAVFGITIALLSRLLYQYDELAFEQNEAATAAFVKVLSEVPNPIQPGIVGKVAKEVGKVVDEAGEKEAMKAINKIQRDNKIIEMMSNLKQFWKQPYQYFVANICLALGISTFILLTEKILVRLVSHRYHSHGLELRISVNRFARKVVRQLRDYFLNRDPTLYKHQWDAGVLIHHCIGKEEVSKEDFYPLMDDDQADRFFSVIDPDLQGTLGKDQFLAAIDSIYLEQSAIDRAFNDQNRIIEKFDRMLLSLVWAVCVFVLIICVNPPIRFLVSVCAGVFGATAFMFQDTIKMAFKSIVFILFSHPFDADDWIMIDEVLYHVHELGLWTSSYLTTNGHMVYISNLTLVSKPIINLRRSPIMNEFIQVSIMPTTTRTQIQQLEANLLQWLTENQRDYVPTLFIRSVKMTDKEHMILEMNVAHRSNFNDQVKKDFRSRKFMLKLKEVVEDLKIELSPPLTR